jgi:hypothetical protein
MDTPDHTQSTSQNYVGLYFIDGSGSQSLTRIALATRHPF